MSSFETRRDVYSAADVTAGLMAVGSVVFSSIAMGFGLVVGLDARPIRSGVIAVLLALVAARMSARYQALALKAMLFASVAWVVGLTIAVLTENPLI